MMVGRATHDHEWRRVDDSPVIEDRAAIFFEQCEWVEVTGSTTSERHDETFYSYGAECEAERSYRFEQCYFWHADGRGEPLDGDWYDNRSELQEKVIEVEMAGEIVECDPDPRYGRVVVEKDGNKIIYTS